MVTRNNALWNCKNPYQGDFKKVLCVCSAGLLRSPTIAWIMSNHGYNTRACGVHDYALIELDKVLLEWADLIVCANTDIYEIITKKPHNKDIVDLKLPDQFQYRDPELVQLIEEKLKELKLI